MNDECTCDSVLRGLYAGKTLNFVLLFCVYVCINAYSNIYLYMHVYLCIYLYMCIYTYLNTCTCFDPLHFAHLISNSIRYENVTGRPPSIRAWGHQCALYVGIMVVEKVLITGLLAFQFWSSVRDLILAPITDPQVRVAVVVLVIPFFVNVSKVFTVYLWICFLLLFVCLLVISLFMGGFLAYMRKVKDN